MVGGEFPSVDATVQAAYSPHLQRFVESGGDPGIATAVVESRKDVAAYARHGPCLPNPAAARPRAGLVATAGGAECPVPRSSHGP